MDRRPHQPHARARHRKLARSGLAVALAGALALAGMYAHAGAAPGRAGPTPVANLGAPAAPAGQPLHQPRVIASRDGVLVARLVAERRRVTVAGRRVVADVYDGSLIGPTLEVAPGDRVRVTLVNHLAVPTNLHFHGLHVPPTGHADNIYVSVGPGRSFAYSFRIAANAATGTYWYHSHADMTSEGQVFAGLSGVLAVVGLRQLLPPQLRGVTERVLALRDLQVKAGAIETTDIDSDAPTTRTVDGQLDPTLRIAPGETQLWHLANVGADIFYDLRLDGQRFQVLAVDGNPVTRTYAAGHLVMPPGRRFDVLVRGAAAGRVALRTVAYDQGGDHYPAVALATLETTPSAPQPPVAWPVQFSTTQVDLGSVAASRRRRFVLSEDERDSRFFINGRMYDPRRVDVRARLGTVEQWTIANHTDEEHPFHLHTYPMQVMSVNGRRRAFTGVQDEVILPVRGYVVVRIRFADFTGETVFHCHILAHEDHGMMANLLVTR